jgi:hypothetical protein
MEEKEGFWRKTGVETIQFPKKYNQIVRKNEKKCGS